MPEFFYIPPGPEKNDIMRHASSPLKKGVGKEDRIGIYKRSNPERVISLHAIVRIGAVTVPIFSAYGLKTVRTIFNDTLREAITTGLGKAFSPKYVLWLPQLPNTRNCKIMRRVIRRAFLEEDPGDLSNRRIRAL